MPHVFGVRHGDRAPADVELGVGLRERRPKLVAQAHPALQVVLGRFDAGAENVSKHFVSWPLDDLEDLVLLECPDQAAPAVEVALQAHLLAANAEWLVDLIQERRALVALDRHPTRRTVSDAVHPHTIEAELLIADRPLEHLQELLLLYLPNGRGGVDVGGVCKRDILHNHVVELDKAQEATQGKPAALEFAAQQLGVLGFDVQAAQGLQELGKVLLRDFPVLARELLEQLLATPRLLRSVAEGLAGRRVKLLGKALALALDNHGRLLRRPYALVKLR
mmetsp:Transcript_63572/g.176821  ORF Transcript_63572/g.176821 Transcript_63572/m.176821 type:complete len:278 (-) Transcript_63572:958-1791(-)